MTMQMSFDQRRFSRAIARTLHNKQALGTKRIAFDCPGCKARGDVTVDQIVRQVTTTCRKCGHNITVHDKDGGFARTVRGV